MNKRQRTSLSELRECVGDFCQFVPYVQNQVIATFLNATERVLFGVLADHPDNDYLDFDLKTTADELGKIKEILAKEHAKC